jgi:ribosomal protein S18 acetylase RimI-like enzyme
MEGDSRTRKHVRKADRRDAAAVQRLLRMGVYVHIHIDWRLPGEWLDRPGFVVYDRTGLDGTEEIEASAGLQSPTEIIGCMAVAAEPLPAAWVRVAAVDSVAGYAQAEAMFAAILADLDPAINEIAWFLTDYWPLHWLERLGFVPACNVIGYRKADLSIPPHALTEGLVIRPLLMEDIPALEAIEAAAFEPRWRHSGGDLFLAWRQSISFTVALLNGEPVAFQFSTGGDGNAHLSRMTVHPSRQGLGIGAALLANAIEGYRLQNINTVTLNTQADNHPSQRLYERFGFKPTGHSYPVWSYFPKS